MGPSASSRSSSLPLRQEGGVRQPEVTPLALHRVDASRPSAGRDGRWRREAVEGGLPGVVSSLASQADGWTGG